MDKLEEGSRKELELYNEFYCHPERATVPDGATELSNLPSITATRDCISIPLLIHLGVVRGQPYTRQSDRTSTFQRRIQIRDHLWSEI